MRARPGPTPPIVGLDSDNTLVCYDELIHKIALERGLIPPDAERGKKHIRDTIRSLPGGEIEWQKVQGLVYGPRMLEARPADGVELFLRRCADSNVSVYVVSHKTRLANYDDTGTDLRATALSWMDQRGWFDNGGLGLYRDRVYFESSRREKVQRIGLLMCTHFVDDLEETFLEEGFPAGVRKILYAPYPTVTTVPGVVAASSWIEVEALSIDDAQ